MSKKKKEEKIEYPIHEMEEKGKLIIPPLIIAQTTFLHSHCGRDEWSGLLLYDVIKGNPSDPKNFELEAKHIFLMDIGDGASTGYEPDGDIVDIYDKIPEAMEWKIGHIHTHHGGNAYFSSTDVEELNDNVDKHNYYLSLVMCFSGNYDARVVFLSDMEVVSRMTYKGDDGKIKSFKTTKNKIHMVSINMRILYGEIGGFFSDRLDNVKKKAEEAKKAEEKKWDRKVGFGSNMGNLNYFREKDHKLYLPPHEKGDNKLDPNAMTEEETTDLLRNVLMFDSDLKTLGTLYFILTQISKEDEENMNMYYEYLLQNMDNVIEAYFDGALDDDEYLQVINDMIERLKMFSSLPTLSDIVGSLIETFEGIAQAYVSAEEKDVNDRQGILDEELRQIENS